MTFNRWCSHYLTRTLARWPVTPNQVTLVNFGIGLGALAALAAGSWWAMLWGAVGLELFYLLDNCDGELARFRGATSVLGQRLDTLVDTVIHVGLFPAIAVGLVRQGASPSLLTIGSLGAAAVLIIYGLTIVQEERRLAAMPSPNSVAFPGWHDFKNRMRTDYAVLVVVCAVTGWLPVLLRVSVIGAGVLTVAMVVHAARGGRVV